MNIKEISISVEQEQSVSLNVNQEKNVDVGFEKREVVSEERVERAYHDYDFAFNQENGKLKLKMIANNGKEKTIEVDLPTEELVKNVGYNNETQEIIIEWENGQKTPISLKGLVDVYKADNVTLTLDKETNTFKINEEYLTASNIKVDSKKANVQATNVESAIKELKDDIQETANEIKDGVVTGIKGSSENEYRKGQVEITKENIGLGNVLNVGSYSKEESDKKYQVQGDYATRNELPTTLPASDVYAWAKEPIKPTYNKQEIGLGNVDNTSDIDKPISTDMKNALDLKEDKSNLKALAYRDSLSKSDVGLDKVNNVAITEEQVAQIGTNKTDIATLNQRVGNLAGSFQFKGELGSIEELPTASSSNSGYVYIINNKEYVSDGTKWIELGDEGSFVLKTTYESHLNTQKEKDENQDSLIEQKANKDEVIENFNVNGGSFNTYLYYALMGYLDGSITKKKFFINNKYYIDIQQVGPGYVCYMTDLSTNTRYWNGNINVNLNSSIEDLSIQIQDFQPKLTAGDGITIENDVIGINEDKVIKNYNIEASTSYPPQLFYEAYKIFKQYNETTFIINKQFLMKLNNIYSTNYSFFGYDLTTTSGYFKSNNYYDLSLEYTMDYFMTNVSFTQNYLQGRLTAGDGIVIDEENNISTSVDLDTLATKKELQDTSNAHINSMKKQFALGYSQENISATSNNDWQLKTSSLGNVVRAVTYGNGYWVAVGAGGITAYSTDTTNWTSLTPFATTGTLTGAAYGNGRFIIVEHCTTYGKIWSADKEPINFTNIYQTAEGYPIEGIRFINDRFFAVGAGGFLAYSLDGKEWTEVSSSTDKDIIDIAYGNGKYVACCYGGIIVYSYNGNDWYTSSDSSFTTNYRHICFGNNMFVAGGQIGVMRYSNDGINWYSGTSNGGSNGWVRGIAYSNKRFFAVKYGTPLGEALYSEDGITWTSCFSITNQRLWCLTEYNGIFLVGGSGGIIYTLDLGIEWLESQPKGQHIYYRFVLNKNNGNQVIGESYYQEQPDLSNYPTKDEVVRKITIENGGDNTQLYLSEMAKMYFKGVLNSGEFVNINNHYVGKVQFVGSGVIVYLWGINTGSGKLVSYRTSSPIASGQSAESITYKTDFIQLTEGEGITIENGVISANVDLSNYATKGELFSKDYNDLNNKPTIPTKMSELTQDVEFGVSEEDVLEIIERNSEETQELKIGTSTDYDPTSDDEVITSKAVHKHYSLSTESGNQIDLSIDPTTYVMTVSLKNKAGETISTDNIDLPLESMVISARYANGKLYLTTKDGSELEGIDISNIVSGLVPDTRKINGKPLSSDITIDVPTKTSELTNDSDFVTSSQLFSKNYNDLTNKPTIPTNNNQLTNGAGYITSSALSDYAKTSEIPTKTSELTNDSNYATTNQLFSKNYNDLTNKPTIPTKVSELDNDKNYLTSFTETDPTVPSHIKNITTTDITNWNNKSTFSGNYNDLTNKPNLLTKDDVVNLTDNQTISGEKTFNETPLVKIRGAKLPIEYQEVEYIESTGTQFIKTGFVPRSNKYRVVLKFMYPRPHNGLSLFGNSTGAPYSITVYGGRPTFYVGESNNIVCGDSTEIGTLYTLDATADNGELTAIWNGVKFSNTYYGNLNTVSEVFIFGANAGGNLGESDNGYMLYSMQIYDNDVLMRNFIPCYRKSDNVVGLYDTVTKTFFTNNGSGVFKVGNDINLDADKEVKLATIEDIPTNNNQLTNGAGYITSSALNDYAKTSAIPTSTSQLENNSGFVTEEFVYHQVATIPKMDIVVVSSLPTSGIRTKTIYLVNTSTEQGNLYEEYIYINNKWELLGSAKVDLSGYANLNSENSFAKTQTVIGNDVTTLVLKAKHSSWSNIALFNDTGKRLGNIGANGIKPYWWGGEGQNDQIALLGDLAGYAQTTNLKTINGESIVGTGDITIESGSSEIPEVEVASDVTSVNIVPNVYYNVLSRENDLTLVMGGKKAGIFNEYSGQIQVDETPVTVQFTEKIRWNENGEVTKEDSSLKLNGKNTYLFSIVNGIGLITNVANEELDTPTINIADGMFEFGKTPNAELYVIKAPNGVVLYSTTLTFDPMPLSMFDETLGIGEHILTAEAQSSKYTDSSTTFTYIVSGQLSAPTNLVLSTINMLSWDSVENATNYTITLVETGNTLTATNNMYNAETLLQGLEAGTYHLTVTANGDGKIYLTSEPSAPLEVVITGA